MQLQNNIHAFDLVYMYTYMGTLTDANNTVMDIQRVYESPLIYADGGFNADDFPISRSVPGGTLEISLNGNALAFAFTGDQSTNSTLQTYSNSDLILNLTSAGVLPEDYDPETGLDADGQPMPDDAWLRTSRELTVKVVLLPFWIANLGSHFQDIEYAQSFDGQAVIPDVPWAPYVYNGVYGQLYIAKKKDSTRGTALYTGLHIETLETAPNTRYLHGSAAFKGAFQVWETAGMPQNGLTDWATSLVIPSARAYRVLPPVSFNQVMAISDCTVNETSMDKLTGRGMNIFMLEDNMFPTWTKTEEVGTVTWNLVGFEKDGYSYTGTMVLSGGQCVVTVTRSDMINDPTVITETYSVNTAIYDVPPKGTWTGWDYDRGGCIWTQPPVDGNDGESGYDAYVPYSSGWHDLEGVDILWSEITPDNVPIEIQQWIADEEIDTTAIRYSLYDGGIVNITEPKEWYFANGAVINPQTSFEQVALPYSPVGYTNWDAGLTSAIGATPDTNPVTDPDEAMLMANQYAKIDGDRSSVILPGEVAAMFNVPVCAHNFARNIVGATVTFTMTTSDSISENIHSGQSISYDVNYPYSATQARARINNGNRVVTTGTLSAIGIIDRSNQDYVKMVCVGTMTTQSASSDGPAWKNLYLTYDESNYPMMGEGDQWSVGNQANYGNTSPESYESYALGNIIFTTGQGLTVSRPTEVLCLASIFGAERMVFSGGDVLWIEDYYASNDYSELTPRYLNASASDDTVIRGYAPSQASIWTGGTLNFSDTSPGEVSLGCRFRGEAYYQNSDYSKYGQVVFDDSLTGVLRNFDGFKGTGFYITNSGGGYVLQEPDTVVSGDGFTILKYIHSRLVSFSESYAVKPGQYSGNLDVDANGVVGIGTIQYPLPSPWDMDDGFGKADFGAEWTVTKKLDNITPMPYGNFPSVVQGCDITSNSINVFYAGYPEFTWYASYGGQQTMTISVIIG